MAKKQFGGSFAPPLTDKQLDNYEDLANECDDPQVQDYMLNLVKMVRKFRETEPSKKKGTKHPSGVGTITQLEDAEIERIWDVVPWMEETKVMSEVFDRISPDDDKELRNAAHHLLWFAVELSQDREPLTNDKL
jgi:hypothetical protein